MDRVLINGTGQILKSSTGAILKERAYNEMVLQDGLEFWGAADPAFLTVDLGLVSEAYDLRTPRENVLNGTGKKMVQNTSTNRLSYTDNSINCVNSNRYLSTPINYNFRSGFIVCKTSLNYVWLGNGTGFLGAYTGTEARCSTGQFYRNSSKIVGSITLTNTGIYLILHSLLDVNNLNQIINVGSRLGTGNSTINIKEWGFYNRVLSEQETIYNVNALNQKYGIF